MITKSKWPIENIGVICQVIAGQSPPSYTYNDEAIGLPFFQGKADFGEIYPKVRLWCNNPIKIAQDKDILISVRAPVGPTNICSKKSCIGRGLSAIRAGSNVYYKYLFYFFRSIEKWISGQGRGSTFSAITQSEIKQIPIPLPPLDIQKKIAVVLDKADRLRQLRKQAMEKLDKLEKSLFMDLFGDPALNKKGFNLVPLEDLYSKIKNGVKCGPFGSALKKDEYTNEGIPVWIMDNIKENQFCEEGCLYISNEKFYQLKHYSVENGDILISRAGTVGKMCVLNYSKNPSIISTNLIKLSLDRDKIEPYYFTSLMTFFKGRVSRLKTGDDGSYTFMNTGILNKLKISLPPYNLQRRYVAIANKIQLIKNKMIMDLQKQDILFNSLLQGAFKGELEFNDEFFDKLEKEKQEVI